MGKEDLVSLKGALKSGVGLSGCWITKAQNPGKPAAWTEDEKKFTDATASPSSESSVHQNESEQKGKPLKCQDG